LPILRFLVFDLRIVRTVLVLFFFMFFFVLEKEINDIIYFVIVTCL